MTYETKLTQRQRRMLKSVYATAIVTCGLMTATSHAQDRVWDASSSNAWNTAANWTAADVPDTSLETALFTSLGAGQTNVDLNTSVTIAGVRYDSTAPAYTITFGANRDMTLSGFGIDNQSSNQQTFSLSSANSDLIFNSNDATIVGGTGGVVINNAGGNVTFNLGSDAGNATINNSTNGADLTFNNTSSALNATINNTNRGRVTFADDSTAGDAVINNTGVSNAQRSTTAFTEDSDSGTANITNNAFGETVFDDDSTAGRGAGQTTITNLANANTLFNDQSSAEDAIINNQGGTTTFDTSGTNANTGTAAGAGTATITNTLGGDLVFDGTSSAQDATIVNDGAGSTTTFNNNTFGGTADITNRNGGSTSFDGDAESAVFTNEDGGTTTFETNSTGPDFNTGGLVINEVGGTTIFENNADGSNTRIQNAGTVDITLGGSPTQIGSIDGSGNVLLGNDTLEIGNLNLDDTISGVISGNGGELTKVGTGNLTLTGTNTYTGDTTVEDGTLTVGVSGAGSITSDTNVETNGTLSGDGTIFGTLDINGGTLAPGSTDINSASRYGQLTVNDSAVGLDVDMDPGSTFITNVSGDQNSSLYTPGTADIDGDLSVNVDGPVGLQQTYQVVITDGGLTGTFDTVTIINDNGDFVAEADYDAFIAYLTLRRTTLGLPGDNELTENQRSIARTLNNWYTGSPDQGTIGFYNEFFGILLDGNVARNLSVASGEGLTGVPVASQAQARRFLERLLQQLQQQSSNQNGQLASAKAPRLVYNGTRYAQLLAQATAQPVYGRIGENSADSYNGSRSSIWATIGRSKEDIDNDDNNAGFDLRSTDYQVGYSRVLSPRTVLGLSIGKSDGRFNADDASTEADTDTTSVGVAVRHDSGDWYATGGISYNRHDIDSERNLGGLQFEGDTDGRTIELSGEVGKKIVRGGWKIEPNISLNLANTRIDGYTEDGGGGALSVDDGKYNTRRLGLGVRIASNNNAARFRPYFFAGYQREFGDRRVELNNSLAGIGAFPVEGTELGRNIWKLRLGADARVSDRFSLIGEIAASWRKNQDSRSIYGGVKYQW